MEKKQVLDTVLLQKREITTPQGRRYAAFEVAYPGFDYTPGQFVMIQARPDQWSYPHLIQRKTPGGFEVLAGPGSQLYACNARDSVAAWAPNGTGIENGPLTLVAEAATYFLVLPFVRTWAGCTVLLVGSEDCPPLDGEDVPVTRLATAGEAAAAVEAMKGPVAAALNPAPLAEFVGALSSARKGETKVYANTRIGCGIGACRSCYLHDPDLRAGVPVCCAGPYMPADRIDFGQDMGCLQIIE